MIVNLNNNDLDDNALAVMLKTYNVCKFTIVTLNNSQIAFKDVATLHSESSQDAQKEFYFYFEIVNDQNDFVDDFVENQMQLERYVENYEKTFDHLLTQYTIIYDQQWVLQHCMLTKEKETKKERTVRI